MGNLARYHVENLPELMKVIRQNGIGMDDYLDRFFHTPTQQNYPPYNIIQVNNVETKLEVALAGFKKTLRFILNMVNLILKVVKKRVQKSLTIPIKDQHKDPLVDLGL